MNKKPGFTLDEHRTMGRELYDVSRILSRTSVATSNTYANKDRAAAGLSRALQQVNKARSALEERMFAEYGDRAALGIYYPGHGQRGARGGPA